MKIRNALTIDLEYWYSPELVRGFVVGNKDDLIMEMTKPMLGILDEFGVSATFFVLGEVAKKHPELVEEVYERGHEIGSHAYSHKTLYELGKDKFENEINLSVQLLQHIIKEKPIGFRAPSFSVNNSTRWAFDVLEKHGFKYDSSIFPIKTKLYGVPNAPLHIYKPSADDVAKEDPNAWLPRQFDNPDNIASHREITGKRILQQLDCPIDAFIAGVGTGGTLMGVAEALKKVNPNVRIVAVEPAESAVMSGNDSGYHEIQGIGPGFIPSLIDKEMIDSIVAVSTEDAMSMARRLMKDEALMVGISSGANVFTALQVAGEMGDDKTIVTVLPDRVERYISMGVF